MNEFYLGIDVGGTNVKCGVVDKSGKVVAKTSYRAVYDGGADLFLSTLIDQIKCLIRPFKKQEIKGLGVGIPGLIDAQKGIVVCSGNLGWNNVDFIKPLKENFSFKISIANDANVAALGEVKFGVASNYNDCVMLTLGTGVGSGIILGGKIYAGVQSAGAEIGHMVIEAFGKECTCGGRGCLEAYSSATALKQMTKEAMLSDKSSKMWEIDNLDAISGKTAFAYSDVDETAKKVVEKYISYLSVGIVNVANIFRPQAIILGGGVSYEGDKLILPLKKKLKENIFAKGLGPEVELLLASLRNDAGFMGAAALNME